ncbi:MAG: thiamine pyrophosphate-dependent dehydrogenase E1 component subunit alpha [Acidobacteriota bacterium]
MGYDLWKLYEQMYRSRYFEILSAGLWNEGLISGELHPGTGEEAIVAALLSHLTDKDSLALDHRSSPPMIMRGVDPALLFREMLGMSDGLNGGKGGHMHFSSREHRIFSSGIVGAGGSTAVGFALAGRYLKDGSVAVSFSGEGSFNQGGLLEAMNLASAWKLPVIFVCKDDGWSITTKSQSVTGGDLKVRAEGFGLKVFSGDGLDIKDIWAAGERAVKFARSRSQPVFLHAGCVHPEGHFLGFQLKRIFSNPLKEMPGVSLPMIRSLFKKGASPAKKISGLSKVLMTMYDELNNPGRKKTNDPLIGTRSKIEDKSRLDDLEKEIREDMDEVLERVLRDYSK